MQSIQDEPLDKALNQYNIKVLSIRNESYKEKKGVWWIQTDNGYKILKKISNSENTLKYILSAVNHLCQKGIKIPKVNKTKDGSDYSNINGTCFVLSDAENGKNPSYSSPAELKLIVQELGKFHIASEGFSPLSDTKPKIHLGIWIEDYENELEDMNKFYLQDLKNNQNGEIGKLIINEFPFFYERANNAIKGLKGQEYKNWVEKVRNSGCLCHQDFAAGNLFLDSKGNVYILDTDSLTIDIPARDIRKLLNKIMKKLGKWDLNLTKSFIEYYQTTNPLSAQEWKVVMYDLMFPHLFLGAMNKFYYKRDKEWTYQKYLKRIKEMSEFEKTLGPILENFEKIIK